MIVTGQPLPAPIALKKGLIDFIAPGKSRDDLIKAAVNIASQSRIDVASRRVSQWPCIPEMPEVN
jgi:enoyl-CoA hydratase/carnithine racemase